MHAKMSIIRLGIKKRLYLTKLNETFLEESRRFDDVAYIHFSKVSDLTKW